MIPLPYLGPFSPFKKVSLSPKFVFTWQSTCLISPLPFQISLEMKTATAIKSSEALNEDWHWEAKRETQRESVMPFTGEHTIVSEQRKGKCYVHGPGHLHLSLSSLSLSFSLPWTHSLTLSASQCSDAHIDFHRKSTVIMSQTASMCHR